MKFFMHSVIASTVSNVAALVAGHPLDTVRVRLMQESRNITARHCLYETLTHEGVSGLYKGLAQPLMVATPVNSTVFVTTDCCNHALQKRWPEMSSANSSLISGCVAGFATLFVFVPADLLKCRA